MTKASKIQRIDRAVKIPIAKIHPNPWNPNKTTDRQQQAIAESLNEYSQVLEIIVRPHPEIEGEYQIIDGEHRYKELGEEGYVYANVLHGLDDPNGKKLTVILNETRGQADKIELSQLLADIKIDFEDDLSLGLPYSESELDEIIKLADIDWDNFGDDDEGEGEGGEEEEASSEMISITCKISPATQDLMKQAKNLVSDEVKLDKDTAIAWGQVLAVMTDFYLGK
jgi:ParB-like nuclease domain